MAITVPKTLLDATLRHQVDLSRFQAGVVKDVISLLNDSDKELAALVQKRLGDKSFTAQRLTAMLDETKQLIQEANALAAKQLTGVMQDFAEHEVTWGTGVLDKMVLGQLDIVTPAAERLAAIVTDQPFQGALLNEWFDKLTVDKQLGITQALRLGQTQGESVDQMVRRLIGSAKDYEPGIFGKIRNDTEAVVRTAVNHTSNTAQQMLLKQNEDIMQGWTFCATLDGRTTLICASLSGSKWPVGEGPIPPRHFRCRSFALPLLKTWRELGINVDELPPAKRASIGGPVDASMSFSDWLKTQDVDTQDGILGKARGKLFRDGGLTVDKFADSTGNIYSLQQLKEREAQAFQQVFHGNDPVSSGGGHLGKTIPVTGPKDFSNVLAPELDAKNLQLTTANKKAFERGSKGTAEEDFAMLGVVEPALEKKWKAYKPQIKGKMLKGVELSNAEKKILGEIPKEEYNAFMQLVGNKPAADFPPTGIAAWDDGRKKPGWTPVKTIAQAKAQFKSLGIKNIELESVGTNVVDILDMLGEDYVALRNNFPIIDDLFSKWNLKTLKLDGTPGGIVNAGGGKAKGTYHSLKSKLTMSTGAKNSMTPSPFTPGGWTVHSDFRSTFRHELGHHFHYSMDYPLWKEFSQIYDKDLAAGSISKKLSKYAETNAKEYFAETFSVYTNPQYQLGTLPDHLEKYMKMVVGESQAMTLAAKKLAEEMLLKKAAQEAAEKAAADAAAKAAFDKKWKAYKPQIKGKLTKGQSLTAAETKILGELPQEEYDGFMAAVQQAQVKAIDKNALSEMTVKLLKGELLSEQDMLLYSKQMGLLPAEEVSAIGSKAQAAFKAWQEAQAALAQAAKEKAEAAAAKMADEAFLKKWKAYKPQIKGKLVKGIDLTAAETKILGELSESEYDAFMALVNEAKAKVINLPTPPPVGTATATAKPIIPTDSATLRIDDFKKVGGKLGSNEGGTYVNKLTGEQFYIKMPDDIAKAQNEVMATELYKLAGIEHADIRLIDLGSGKWGVASKWIDGLAEDAAALRAGKVAGVYEGYGVDAWLANWDVVGLGYDNMKVLNGVKAIRVDPGGALFYRAQGALKPFGEEVLELKTLLDEGVNPQSAAVFKGMTKAQRDDAIRRVLRIKEADIRATVEKHGALWPAERRKELINILLARQKYIAKQFPELVEKPALSGGKTVVTAADFDTIKKARGNGAAIRIDYDQIEDQQILFHTERLSNGQDGLVGTFKIRESGDKILQRFIADAKGIEAGPQKEYLIKGLSEELNDSVHQYVLDTLKGVGAQINSAGIIRDKDIERARKALQALDNAWDTIKAANGSIPDAWEKHYAPWAGWLYQIAGTLPDTPAAKFPIPGKLDKFAIPFRMVEPAAGKQDAAIQFFHRKGTYTASTLQKGQIIRSSIEEALDIGAKNEFYEATVDGIRIRYWPKNDPAVAYALQGRIQVSVLESSETALNKAVELLDRIGLNVSAPTKAQVEELYLRKLAYHINDKTYFETLKKIDAIATPEERVTALSEYVSELIKTDVTKLPNYKPYGARELWDQGNIIVERPDLDGPEWDEFSKSHKLYHAFWSGDYVGGFDRILESGSKLISSADRVRRGVPWGTSSAASDFRSGGADYVFTRVKPLQEVKGAAGIIWSPKKHLRRLDGISYKGDAYGHVRASSPTGWGKVPDSNLGENGFVITNRSASSIDKWKSVAGSGSNETIFKGGLSIFDDVEQINIPSSQYESVLAVFRKHGFSRWPDGRELTDVIRKV